MDNLIVLGAQGAVASLREALKAADDENVALRAAMAEQAKRHAMDMDRMSAQLDSAQKLLDTAQATINGLREVLAASKAATTPGVSNGH